MKKLTILLAALLAAALAVNHFGSFGKTVSSVQRQLEPSIEPIFQSYISKVGLSNPPDSLQLIAIKDEKQLELWFLKNRKKHFVRRYPILAASGTAGPKLREGDRQVPEGFYRIISLNPNSDYHLSMKIDYPSRFDRAQATNDGRNRDSLGDDIFIHGKAASIGCLAMGDPAIEELFYMVAQVGADHTHIIMVPTDFRKGNVVPDAPLPWVSRLYRDLGAVLQFYRVD
jgi:murein L,D-transpeptidase YafK